MQVQQLSKLEVEDLLKKGAYGALMDEEDEGSKFCEEDIDQILQRRTQTITIQSEGKGSTFAKVADLGLPGPKSTRLSYIVLYRSRAVPSQSINSRSVWSDLTLPCLGTSLPYSFGCFLLNCLPPPFRPVSSHLETEQTFLWMTPTSGRNGQKLPKWRSTPNPRR